MDTRELSELGQEISRNKTVLHQIAIELGLLKDDNFLFQYDFYDRRDNYVIDTPQNNFIISVPKNIEDLDKIPFRVLKKLKEHHFDIGNLTL